MSQSLVNHAVVMNGQQMIYQTIGAGPRLLLIHGFAVSSVIWTDLLADLAGHFELVLIDLPRFGNNANYATEPTAMAYVAFLNACVAELKPKFLLGYSMGAVLCYEYSKEPDESLQHIILLAPALLHPLQAVPLQWLFGCIGMSDLVTALVKKVLPLSPMKEAFFALTSLGNLRKPETLNFTMRELQRSSNSKEVFTLMASVFTVRLAVEQLLTPMTIIMGKQDGLGWFSAVRRVMRTCRQCSSTAIPHAYHLAPLEMPKEVAHAIVSAVRSQAD